MLAIAEAKVVPYSVFVQTIVWTTTEYGTTFASAIASKNVYGTQFHPEKSGEIGLKILKNFAKIVVR